MKTMADIEVKMIADSISPEGIRLCTLETYYPRMVHAELMTHRAFSRNASSSRAMPVTTLLEKSRNELYMPRFRKNKPGMQPGDKLSVEDQHAAEEIWKVMADRCMMGVKTLSDLGVHKQWANRPLEWFGWIRVLISSTEWENFFSLRMEKNEDGWPMAQDEIDYLASRIKWGMYNSEPVLRRPGQWHLPYITEQERKDLPVMGLMKFSAARSARTSYDNLDGSKASLSKDSDLFDKLTAGAIHASPMEHQATPDYKDFMGGSDKVWVNQSEWGNFYGWRQHRQMVPNNVVRDR